MKMLQIRSDERVLAGSAEFVILHVLDLYSVLARGISSGRTERLAISELRAMEDSAEASRPEIELMAVDDAAWDEANRRFEIIRPLLARSRRTREAVEERAREIGVHFTTLYRWISRYQADPRISSLIPTRSNGGKGKGRLPAEIENVITNAIQTHYLKDQQPSVEATVLEVVRLCRESGFPHPSASSVRRRIRRLSEEEVIARRRGRRDAHERFAPHVGNTQEAPHPLALAQIDHTLMDIVIVDGTERLPVGRPWITVLMDVFSRMVLGFYVSLDPPGAVGTGLCFVNSVLPKERWLARLDIEGAWPCWGFPDRVQADNAREFRGNMLKRACKEYGTDLEFRPVGKPEYGSHIERLMGTIGGEIHLLPGSTFSNLEERGAYDSEKMAAFTLEELEAYMARWINTVYHQRLHRGINRTPLALWEDGIRGTRTNPGVGLRPRITDEERLRIDFLPFMERTVQQRGVTIDNVTYYDDKLRPYVDRRDPEHPKRKLALRFHRDPRDISVIYFMDPLTREYSAVPYRNTARPPVSIWELREARRLSLAMGRADVDEDALFKAYAHLMEKQEQAVRTTVKTRRDQTRRDHWRRGERPIPSDARPSGQATDLRAKDEAPAAAPGFPNPVLPPFGEDDELENDE